MEERVAEEAAGMPGHRFLVFADEAYYPNGGWGDFRGAYATHDEAYAAVQAHQQAHASVKMREAYDWYEIVDLRELGVVHSGGYKYRGFGGYAPGATHDKPSEEPSDGKAPRR